MADWGTYRIDEITRKKHDVLVLVPTLNEGKRIHNTLREIQKLKLDIDVCVVDGNSTDGSTELPGLKKLGVSALVTKTSAGKLSTQLLCGFDFALRQGYGQVVTIDGNEKDDPEAIPRIVKALDDGADFVQASRFLPGGHHENTPLSRLLAIRLMHAPVLSMFSGFHWTDTTQGFRGYSRALLESPKLDIFRPVFVRYELLAYFSYRAPKAGFKCAEVPSIRRYKEGEIVTKISPWTGNSDLVKTLFKTVFGQFNPKR